MVYTEMNAKLQASAMQMGAVKYLSQGEVEAAWRTNSLVIERAWDLWSQEVA